MSIRFSYFSLFIGLIGAVVLPLQAALTLASPFSDHMVLQQKAADRVWGWADPRQEVIITVGTQTRTVTAGAKGDWKVTLDPLTPADPLTLTAKAGATTLTVHDVQVGEVWLASGQSNMDYTLGWDKVYNGPDIAASDDPGLRLLTVPRVGNLEPQTRFAKDAAWLPANPANAPGFSAVAYYFARQLRQKLKVPVGVIVSSYGGTRAEAWVSLSRLEGDPKFQAAAGVDVAAMKAFPETSRAFAPALAKWIAANREEDAGNQGEAAGWARPDFNDADWKTMTVRSSLGQAGMTGGGVVWWRKSVVLPAAQAFLLETDWTSGELTVYFNGTRLREADTAPPFAHAQRRFEVPATLIHAGQPNAIAIRQYALTSQDGFYQTTAAMRLPVPDPKALDNAWKFKAEQTFAPLTAGALQALPHYPEATIQNTPAGLFNAMIQPLLPYRIEGAIWYQGESNASNPQPYTDLLTLLIDDWRQRWGESRFPFYIEQLANYGTPPVQPEWSGVPLIREAQLKVSQTVPDTGLAVAIDIGEETIHPRNKREVGRRLSLLALNRAYGQTQPDSGPIYDGMTEEGAKIRLRFQQLNGGLVTKDGPLRQFAIAGADQKFAWADAVIDGETVVVSSPAVPAPVAVRYAWASNPAGCNLYSADGLPASPFRTDAWDPKKP